MKLRYLYVALAALLAPLMFLAAPARAAVATSQLTLPVGYTDGVALDALGWGGTGTAASCATGTAAINDEVGVWETSRAGCAADWDVLTVTAATTTTPAVVRLEYAPDGNLSGYCVSTVTDVERSYARLRPCANPGTVNQWQDFTETAAASDIPGAVVLEAASEPPVYALNDRAFGKDGSPVISWPPTTGENQLWSIGPSS